MAEVSFMARSGTAFVVPMGLVYYTLLILWTSMRFIADCNFTMGHTSVLRTALTLQAHPPKEALQY